MDTIRFPHLHLVLRNVPQSFGLGSFSIACYGIIVAAAAVSGLWIAMRVAEYTGQKEDDYFNYGLLTIVVSILCARIYYVVFSWEYYRDHLGEILNLRGGGLAIYGGVLGGILFTCLYARRIRKPVLVLLDTAMPGLVWGQMLGRWGNFFNREAFGGYTDCLTAMQLPLARVNPEHVTGEMTAHLQEIDGVTFLQVHPTFLYESLWNLGVFLILLCVIRKGAASAHTKRPSGHRPARGTVFFLYLILYGIGRFWIEGLRTDQLLIPHTVIPVSQALSAVLVLCGAAGWALVRRKHFPSEN